MKTVIKHLTQPSEINESERQSFRNIENRIENNPLKNAKLLTLDVTTSATKKLHGLKRIPKGFVEFGTPDFKVVAITAWDKETITIAATSGGTATILIY